MSDITNPMYDWDELLSLRAEIGRPDGCAVIFESLHKYLIKGPENGKNIGDMAHIGNFFGPIFQ